MPEFLSFGQPMGAIIQTAYVVPSIERAIEEWTARLGVGPWFLFEHFRGENAVYRGQPSEADVAIAMTFAGHMNIELIQPHDDHPSVYREAIEARGYGFHHWGLASRDVPGDLARYAGQGMDEAFRAGVPTGGEVVYVDTRGTLPGFIELIPVTAGMEEVFGGFHRASLDWDGTDPIRPFV